MHTDVMQYKRERRVIIENMEIKRGDVYFCKFEKNGSVQGGERPCVVVSNNSNNKFSDIVIVAPITSANKKKIPTHVPIMVEEPSTILCEQLITVAKSKLGNKIGRIKQMNMIDKSLKIALGVEIY